jgi:hypothetical protein
MIDFLLKDGKGTLPAAAVEARRLADFQLNRRVKPVPAMMGAAMLAGLIATAVASDQQEMEQILAQLSTLMRDWAYEIAQLDTHNHGGSAHTTIQ